MKGPLDRTKIVLRHLPHTISQSALMDQIDARFSDRYNWFSFRSAKNSLKCQSYSRAYIDFKHPEDVIEFAEFFDGHIFVNEKGTQFKTIVEYAPSQRVPKQWSKKDGREGTIGKDPEYLEFLDLISKPIENLPSAEIQLERKEAERSGAFKEAPIVTPLMDFVRQKRAAKGGPRRSLPNGKVMRRAGASSSSSSSTALKRGSEKRTSTTMYVLRESGKCTNTKDKSAYVHVPKRDDRHLSEKSVGSSAASGSVVPEEERGAFGGSDTGKKKILLLKGKEKEIPHVVTSGSSLQQNSSAGKFGGARQNQRHEASGRIIRSILLNKQNQSDQPNQDRDRRPPRSLSYKDSNGLPDDYNEKHDKRSRSKDKPDRGVGVGVWTPLRSHATDDSFSSSTQVLPDSAQGTRREANERVGGRGGHLFADNGSHKHSGRRPSSHIAKDADGPSNLSEGKGSKRGVSAGYASHEKRVWVQKSSSGS